MVTIKYQPLQGYVVSGYIKGKEYSFEADKAAELLRTGMFVEVSDEDQPSYDAFADDYADEPQDSEDLNSETEIGDD